MQGLKPVVLAATLLAAGAVTLLAAGAATAAECPGNPDALGTSRTIVVDPVEHPRLGSMQYRESLPLADREVVLTFDDGPLPPRTNHVLDTLASECVKATFFLVGRQAQANPEGVRKVLAAGHTVATHTMNHPSGMHRLTLDRAKQEIDGGIASVTAALGENSAALSPFFRIPGLARNDGIEEYAKSKGLQVWSADFPADDWRNVSSTRVHDLAMQRLAGKGKGILLLHDIQARTVASLPRILHDLKARGYRIVHVVPATPEQPATPTEPQQWQLHPPSETVAISHWPKIPNFVFSNAEMLPGPALSDLDWRDGQSMTLAEASNRASRPARRVPLPREALWPRQSSLALAPGAANVLPVPALSIFEIQERPRAPTQELAAPSHHAEQTVPTEHETNGLARLISVDASDPRGTIPVPIGAR
jgi:peptidoglycan/xylan/chitin deacetylase (PgdA/CDA1 family)